MSSTSTVSTCTMEKTSNNEGSSSSISDSGARLIADVEAGFDTPDTFRGIQKEWRTQIAAEQLLLGTQTVQEIKTRTFHDYTTRKMQVGLLAVCWGTKRRFITEATDLLSTKPMEHAFQHTSLTAMFLSACFSEPSLAELAKLIALDIFPEEYRKNTDYIKNMPWYNFFRSLRDIVMDYPLQEALWMTYLVLDKEEEPAEDLTHALLKLKKTVNENK